MNEQDETLDSILHSNATGLETEAGLDDAKVEPPRERKVPVLTIINSDGVIREVEIDKPQFYLGRSTDCDLQITQPNASRYHAFISFENINSQEDEPVCLVEDNESRNGTWHNGSRLKKPKRLAHGDRLLIGNAVINFLVRQEWELESNRRIVDVMNRYNNGDGVGRVSCSLATTVKILIPDQTFTPFTVNGKIHDIDAGGVRLVTSEVSQDLWLMLIKKKEFLKTEILIESLDMKIKGRMAWSHYDSQSDNPLCIMGLEFTRIDDEGLESLREALSQQGIVLGKKSAD